MKKCQKLIKFGNLFFPRTGSIFHHTVQSHAEILANIITCQSPPVSVVPLLLSLFSASINFPLTSPLENIAESSQHMLCSLFWRHQATVCMQKWSRPNIIFSHLQGCLVTWIKDFYQAVQTNKHDWKAGWTQVGESGLLIEISISENKSPH